MTKKQLEEIVELLHQLGWDRDRARRHLGYSVFNNPEDTSPVLARSSIIKLRGALAAAPGRTPAPEEPAGQTITAAAPRPSSVKQRAFIRSLLERSGLTEADGARIVESSSIDQLSIQQASTLIDELLKMADSRG